MPDAATLGPISPFFIVSDLGAEVTQRDDGLRGFEIRDADGYVLFFGGPAEEPR